MSPLLAPSVLNPPREGDMHRSGGSRSHWRVGTI